MMIFFLSFLGLVICLLVLLVQIILVVWLFCIVRFWRVGLLFACWIVLVEFSLRGSVFRVASIYAPNRNPDRDAFLVRCTDSMDPAVPLFCAAISTRSWTVFWIAVGRPFDISRESSALLSAMFLDCCAVDIWCERHPTDSAFTWFQPDGALASHIDLISCPYAWVPYVSSVDILPCPFSDHCALSFSWALPNSIPHQVPSLEYFNKGRDVYLVFCEDIGNVLQKRQRRTGRRRNELSKGSGNNSKRHTRQ